MVTWKLYTHNKEGIDFFLAICVSYFSNIWMTLNSTAVYSKIFAMANVDLNCNKENSEKISGFFLDFCLFCYQTLSTPKLFYYPNFTILNGWFIFLFQITIADRQSKKNSTPKV